MSDASFAILEMRKSVKAHLLKTTDLSVAIYVHVGAVKNIVTRVWEAEITLGSYLEDKEIEGMKIKDWLIHEE